MSRDVFYSKQEAILFYVAGYTDNSDKVVDIEKVLNDGVVFLEKIAFIDTRTVKTKFITHSRRYKHMRVFYVETHEIPKEAFIIGEKAEDGWTMMKWLED